MENFLFIYFHFYFLFYFRNFPKCTHVTGPGSHIIYIIILFLQPQLAQKKE